MSRKPVKSSNIKSVGYDSKTKTLEIEFQDGAVHEYLGVPVREYTALLAAKSVGGYFHAHIRHAYKSRPA